MFDKHKLDQSAERSPEELKRPIAQGYSSLLIYGTRGGEHLLVVELVLDAEFSPVFFRSSPRSFFRSSRSVGAGMIRDENAAQGDPLM